MHKDETTHQTSSVESNKPWNQGYLPHLKTKKKEVFIKKKSIIKLWIKYDNNNGSKADINKMERNRPISNSFFNILDHLFLSN